MFITRWGISLFFVGVSPWELQVTPYSDGMFGGKEVNVSGPCFMNPNLIKCRFGSSTTNGWVSQNAMRASCHVPAQGEIGHVTLSVSIDGGSNWHFKTDFLSGKAANVMA